MKRLLCIFLTFFLFTACEDEADTGVSSAYMQDKLIIQTATGEKHTFMVELALVPWQQQRGLMHRTKLAEDAGMLFWFGGKETERSFWMKNTLIPLDMLFIKADGTIHHIHAEAQPHNLNGAPSNGPVAAVLEINGGLSQKLGIRVGDIVQHSFFE